MPDQDVEQNRLDLDRQRLDFEREQWQGEVALKKVEQDRSRWVSPLVIAIFTVALAGLGNIVLAFVNGSLQRASDTERAKQTRELERSKSEALLVLEMIKTADPDKAAANLAFLADSGLLSDKDQVERIHTYLRQRTPGQGPSLPPSGGLGDALLKQGKIEEAVAELRKAIERDPSSAAAHGSLGTALRLQGKTEEAVVELRKAVELDPRSAFAHGSLGDALLTQGKTEDAVAELRKAAELDPRFASAHGSLGYALRLQGKTAEAMAELRKAVGLDPNDAFAHRLLGGELLNQGKPEAAIAEIRKAVELDPRSAFAHGSLGDALLTQGKTEDAVAELRKAAELDPRFAIAHRSLGAALHVQGKIDEAISEFRTAVELDHKDPYSVLWFYLARTRSGAHNAAMAELETNAKNLSKPDWPYPVIELYLGRRTPEATLAAATTPDDRCEAQFYIGEWHLLRGDHLKATAALKAASDTCPKTFMEYVFARAELQRLRR